MPFYPSGAPYLHQGMSGLTEPFSPPTAVTITIDTMAGALIDPVHHNSVIAIVSVRTAGNSVLGYVSTNDEVAKFFYILSFGLATSAAGLSANAALCKYCQISQSAVLSEGFAEMLYRTGEKARKMAETKAETSAKALMEAQQIAEMNSKALAIRSNRLPIFSSNPENIAFVPTCPDYVKTTGDNLIFIFKIYGSIRITHTVYKRAKKII